MAVQAKLLRVLESGEIRKIGDNEPHRVDVRVVCATHRNLEKMVEDGAFREDLMFRINTFEIYMPHCASVSATFPNWLCTYSNDSGRKPFPKNIYFLLKPWMNCAVISGQVTFAN